MAVTPCPLSETREQKLERLLSELLQLPDVDRDTVFEAPKDREGTVFLMDMHIIAKRAEALGVPCRVYGYSSWPSMWPAQVELVE